MDKTVAKALRLLEKLAARSQPVGAAELARDMALTRSNTHRLLETLATLGFAERHVGGTYGLSPKLLTLGATHMSRSVLQRFALPRLRALAEETAETTGLWVPLDDKCVLVEMVETTHPVVLQMRVGQFFFLHCTSPGKALLAHMSAEARAKIVANARAFTPRTIVDAEQLEGELEAVRTTGFAINVGEARENGNGVAAPIFDHSGRTLGALAISAPSDRLPMERLAALGERIRRAAADISLDLGFLPNSMKR